MSTAYIAAFDVGTTALKGILAAPDGTIAAACSRSIPTLFEGAFRSRIPAVGGMPSVPSPWSLPARSRQNTLPPSP